MPKSRVALWCAAVVLLTKPLDEVDIEYVQCDVSDADQVNAVVAQLLEKYGKIAGIVHCAGVLRDGYLINKDIKEAKQVLSPKVDGINHIDHATQALEMDFVMLFSSVAGALGGMGQGDYGVANAYLDEFAHYRNQLVEQGKRHGHTISVNWPLWKDGGMQAGEHNEQSSKNVGLGTLATNNGLKVLDYALGAEHSQLMAVQGNRAKLLSAMFAGVLAGEVEPVIEAEPVADFAGDSDFASWVRKALIACAAEVQKMDESKIKLGSQLSAYGFDSISFAKFANHMNREYDLGWIPTVFFEYPTLEQLAVYLEESPSDTIRERYQAETAGNSKLEPVQLPEAKVVKSRAAKPKLQKRFAGQVAMHRPAQGTPKVAIIGMSGRFPGSNNLDDFWQHLAANDDLISKVPAQRWDSQQYAQLGSTLDFELLSSFGGYIDGIDHFDNQFFDIPGEEAVAMEPQQRLFIETCWACIEDAGYAASSLSGRNVGVFVGLATELKNLDLQDFEYGANPGLSYHFMVPNRLSYLLNIHGPSEPIDTACSSSLVAIHRAVKSIAAGDCEMALAGGVNVIVNPLLGIIMGSAGMLSPDGRCKTFDESADGYGRSEGVGVILLKPLDKAEQDGDHIYGIVRGSGVNHGGKGASPSAPNAAAIQTLLRNTYEDAKVSPAEVSYIECHGTGTKLGDPIEVNALKKVFNALYAKQGLDVPADAHCGLGSIKTNIGHPEAAAGIAGVIKVLLMMQHQTIVGNGMLKTPNPFIDIKDSPFYLVDDTSEWPSEKAPRIAGISGFGIGGSNAHVILEEYRASKPVSNSMVDKGLLVLSAKTQDQLFEQALNLLCALENDDKANLSQLCYTLQVGRDPMQERLAFVAENTEQAKTLLAEFIENGGASGIYQGSVDLDEVIASDISFQNDDELLKQWVKGAEVDWLERYPVQNRPNRMPLPSYPFSRTKPVATPTQTTKVELSQVKVGQSNHAESFLRKLVAGLLDVSVDKVSASTGLIEQGMTSKGIIVITREIKRQIDGGFSPDVFFEHTTIASLAGYLTEKYPSKIRELKSELLAAQTSNATEDDQQDLLLKALEALENGDADLAELILKIDAGLL